MMRTLALGLTIAAAAGLVATPAGAADPKRKPPYFASIAASKARMRTGPARTYPASWLYVRPELPIKVIDLYKEWRKVEDPDGTQGWIQANLLSDKRTGMVQGAIAELREHPDFTGKVAWRAEPGVVGRLSQCGNGWCRIDVRGQSGFVEASHLWGVSGDEVLP